MRIPFYSLEIQHSQIRDAIINKFSEVYDSGWYVLGKESDLFEKKLSSYCNSNYAIGTGNGYEALQIALKSLGVGEGDDVIVPAHTFIATWNAVIALGAKPIPVDVNASSFNIDPALIDEKITSKTKVILPVHLYGNPADMDSIMKLANKLKLGVVEDFAQAIGAEYKGKMVGSIGHVNATSFYPSKNLGALGDGGAIVTNDKELAATCRRYRNYGSDRKYYYEEVGINSRLDELQAAFLATKLEYLNNWNQQRIELANYYIQQLQELEQLILPTLDSETKHVFHLFVVRTTQRDALQKFLREEGVETVIHYPIPPHLQIAYKHLSYKKGDFPNTENISETCLSLPLYPGMRIEQVDFVIEKVKDFFLGNK